jgi:prevent-host-death family protein
MTTMSVSEARQAFAEVVDRVKFGERVVLEKNGKRVLALVSIEDLELLRMMEDRVDLDEARKALAEADKKGYVSWDKIKADLKL